MLSSFESIKNSKFFPFQDIIGVLDWRNNFHKVNYKTDKNEIYDYVNKGHKLVPVFLIAEEHYVPKEFGKTNKPAYPGMNKNTLDLFKKLSDIKYTTIPILTEIIDNYQYGLIKWYQNSQTFFEKWNEINLTDIAQIIECGLELEKQNVFHLDLNFGNIIKNKRVYFIDPSLAENHFRPLNDYFDERSVNYHWSPEILNGGYITGKSSIYSIGKTIKFCNNSLDKKVISLINSFLDKSPENRPSFDESYKRIKEII